MAQLADVTHYRDGEVIVDSDVVGFESLVNRNVRYTIQTSPTEMGSRLSFSIKQNFDPWSSALRWGMGSTQHEGLPLYFVIGTDPDEFANAGLADISRAHGKCTMTLLSGYYVEENTSFEATGEAELLILPNKTYYLWIFPGYSNLEGGNNTWGWFWWSKLLDATYELSGAAGLVHLDTGSGWISAIPYIDNGEEWQRAIPYVDNGSGWDLCS